MEVNEFKGSLTCTNDEGLSSGGTHTQSHTGSVFTAFTYHTDFNL